MPIRLFAPAFLGLAALAAIACTNAGAKSPPNANTSVPGMSDLTPAKVTVFDAAAPGLDTPTGDGGLLRPGAAAR